MATGPGDENDARELKVAELQQQILELRSELARIQGISIIGGRPFEVMDYVCLGLENKEIAARMNISPQTVKNHMTTILRMYRCRNRTHAALKHLSFFACKVVDDCALKDYWAELPEQMEVVKSIHEEMTRETREKKERSRNVQNTNRP